MGTVETRSKSPPEGSSSAELVKPQGSEHEKKGLNEALRKGENVPSGVSVKGSKENDGTFPINGDGGLDDDGVVEVVKSRFVETTVPVQGDFGGGREIDISGPNDCKVLTDSEMNGVSSLLELRESERKLTVSHCSEERAKSEDEDEDEGQDGKIVTEDVPIVETSESKDVDVETEDVSDEGHKYSVGDFVWGKIKSHPWWPGRIYDPSDASDYALKVKTKDRVLVAYFGDGTFAWCHPSQLKPFEENFDDMVKQSSSRAFINAVQEAVNEVGRLLDLEMSCSYAAMGKRTELVQPLVKNFGIKEGVYVPKTGIEKLSTVLSDPAELLSRVKQIAEAVAIPSVLELGILKARLLAFYLTRGGYKLPTYHEPQPIPGLEDSLVDKSKDASNGGEVEVPVQGPFEEEYPTPKSGETSNPLGIFGRKQKSIAEILGEDSDIHTKYKERDADEEAKDMDYPIVSFGRKKRKSTEETLLSKSVEKRTMHLAKNDGSGCKENSENLSSPRERKKSKYLSPPFTTPSMWQKKRDMEEESLEVSDESQLAERDLSDISNLQMQEDDENQKTIDLLKIQVPAGEVLSEIHSIAISPHILRDIISLERSVYFISVYRSSMYHEGSYYKTYNKPKRGRKRKKSESEPESLKKDQNQTDHDSVKKRRRMKNKSLDTTEPDTKVGRKAKKGSVELASAAALFVYFGPGSSLPSKSDLITTYGKFGVLNEEETDMFRTNYTARVCFQRTSDAERAFNHSQNMSPFGCNSVKFGLQYINSSAGKSKSKASLANPSASKLPGNEKSKLNFIKQKLESLNSLIKASDGKSPDAKKRLETELKVLLEDVNKMVESCSSS